MSFRPIKVKSQLGLDFAFMISMDGTYYVNIMSRLEIILFNINSYGISTVLFCLCHINFFQ
jgi:hypothetical protein